MNFSEAYEKYYAILNSSYRTGNMVIHDNISTSSENSLITETNNLITVFLGMVEKLRDYEKRKEEQYLRKWLDKLSNAQEPNGQKLKDLLAPLILTEDQNFTQAFQLVELWRQGFIHDVESIPQIYEDWREEFTQFSNKTIVTSARAAVEELANNGELITLTPPQLMDKIIQRIELDWENTNSGYSKENFQTFLNNFSPYLVSIVRDMKEFRVKETKKRGRIDPWGNGSNLGTIFKIKEQKDLQETISSKIITGLVNGLSQEMSLVAFAKGASTARASRELRFLNEKVMNLATETDVYSVLTFDLGNNSEAVAKIAAMQQDKDIQELISNSDYKNNFIIHYSSKDLTIAEANSSSVTAKIKGEGGFGSKVIALQEMGNAAGKADEVHDLIFKAVNIGHQLLYSNYQDKLIDLITAALTSLTFSFMFDDFERQFEHIENNIEGNNTELNLYIISGNYYPASDILQILYNYVNSLRAGNKIGKKFIDIGFKPSSMEVDKYIYQKQKKLNGDALWADVRDAVMADAKMKVVLATNYLKELTYAIQKGDNLL